MQVFNSDVIDFKAILAVENIAGTKYLIVEEDQSRDNTMMDDIKTSITNLRTEILVQSIVTVFYRLKVYVYLIITDLVR